MKNKETLLSELLENVQIDNLDLDYFINNSEATSFEELEEYIQDQNGFDVDIIYYINAIEFLKENDPSLNESLEIAGEYSFELKNLNSEILASLLASKYCREDFNDNKHLIENYYTELEELNNEDNH